MLRYCSNASLLRFVPIYIKLTLVAFSLLIIAFFCKIGCAMFAEVEGNMWAGVCDNLYAVCRRCTTLFIALAFGSAGVAAISYGLMPATARICAMVREGLYHPSRGNPLHLRDGDLLPQIRCSCVGAGVYDLVISAQQGATVEAIVKAASSISAALNNRYQHYAVIRTSTDVAYNCVVFRLADVKIDHSITFESVIDMLPENCTKLRVDKASDIDLTTSGSILVAGKTRSGKTTGVIALLLQVLLCGADNIGSSVVIIDPKQAELSRLPYTVTLDSDGSARPILDVLNQFAISIVRRQQFLNDLSEQTGDAVKWWEAGMHPSILFIDEYVACRSIFPKKAAKDSDYCLDTFDGLVKRIVTMGASAGCFVIISIAEASVQEGGLPTMLRSAMSTKVLFRPTLIEGRLLWDSEKLADFATGKVYGQGEAWFSSTDGVHDEVSHVQFPRMRFAVYRELGNLLQTYYG